MPRGDRVSRRVFRAHGVGDDVQINFGPASVTPQLRARADAVLAGLRFGAPAGAACRGREAYALLARWIDFVTPSVAQVLVRGAADFRRQRRMSTRHGTPTSSRQRTLA
jgi:hypothetical protein